MLKAKLRVELEPNHWPGNVKMGRVVYLQHGPNFVSTGITGS
jgi:hypothetical protein